VLADADPDDAVEAAAFGAFMHQGQICMINDGLSAGVLTGNPDGALDGARPYSLSSRLTFSRPISLRSRSLTGSASIQSVPSCIASNG
jgi:hypothetical protein